MKTLGEQDDMVFLRGRREEGIKRSMRRVIVIVGPTAAGKTALAIELAQRLPGGGECIGADSMQVYRGMDIGTAKPTASEQATVRHHLLDIADPADDGFTVDRWLEAAEAAITDVLARHKWPIVVGGTNLYVRALLEGMLDGPEPDPRIRSDLEKLSIEELRPRLIQADPAAAERIHPNDRRRTIRALEIFTQTGKPISELQKQWGASIGSGARPAGWREQLLMVGLDYPVEAINRRINARVKAMIENGLVDEVRKLMTRGLGRQAREALGYKQVLQAIERGESMTDAIEQIKIRSRRYAKQQRTWLRRFRTWPGSIWLDAAQQTPAEMAAEVVRRIDFLTRNEAPGEAEGTDPA